MATAAPLARSDRRRGRPALSLRLVAAVVVPSLALLIVILATWLVASIRTLDSAVHDVVAHGRRARHVQEVETALLTYQRLSNTVYVRGAQGAEPAAALDAVEGLLRRADAASRTPADRRDMATLRGRVDEYTRARRELEAAHVPIAELVDGTRAPLNATLSQLSWMQRQFQDDLAWSERRAAVVTRRANVQGAAVILLVVLSAAFVLMMFRAHVVDPLDKVRSAILEFRTSGRAATAQEVGPVEIREIARALNETTSALADDRKHQLAFVAGVAHDLKSPLTALTLAVSLLEDPPPGPQRAAARARALRQIAGNTARLRRMVDDLMDVTRSEAGELALDLAEVDLRDPVRDVVDLHFVDTGAHSIVLTVPDEPVRVRGDAARIEQALVNLVSNAIKYSPGGGSIRIEVARTTTEAVISVSDEGVGIPENELPALFEPFHRGTVSKHVAPGAGLGLSILARIVRAHGGRVDVESELGAGSCFRVFLPLAIDERRHRAPPAAPAPE